MTTNIYILRLEEGKYYIGKSNDVLNRYQQHINGDGSAWTRKYRPLALEKTIEHVSPFEEDKITKEYMSIYGVDNVRGGAYVETELTDAQKKLLYKEIWAAKDLCTQCGQSGHFAEDCSSKTAILGPTLEYDDEDSDDEDSDDEDSEDEDEGDDYVRSYSSSFHSSTTRGACYRCGRLGHYASDCYARQHING